MAVVTLLAATLLGCSATGTRMVNSWRDPAAGPLRFQKVLVLFIAPHQSQRQFGEAELVRLMTRTKGVAAHSVMTQDEAKDEGKMRAVMAREGYDGAITMRFIGTDQQLSYQSGVYVPAYSGFWNYYSVAWPMVYDAGYVRTDRRVQMETQVYSMKDDKLVWSGLSESMNPASAQELVDDVAQAVVADLRKQRLIE